MSRSWTSRLEVEALYVARKGRNRGAAVGGGVRRSGELRSPPCARTITATLILDAPERIPVGLYIEVAVDGIAAVATEVPVPREERIDL